MIHVTLREELATVPDVTFVLDTPQSTCCSDRSPEPPALHDCRSSESTRENHIKNPESTT